MEQKGENKAVICPEDFYSGVHVKINMLEFFVRPVTNVTIETL